ncbi:hypothetical protein DFA_02945 [Cavenderia fasciculata]|uniref:Uncharacterized protein n=1 Tax=Cavenderia fasciculata TaxID=261658 RepID=F4PG67_CACFS|nr:uncharacterized protein DFA_02945 [Cavenderia fasciculata]EGG24701.1 hypothetical protein DFA_02945 [Cavenderia fasciculata]|eukprot:XP_004362552.1 hypothetical protein DFA_02945 [Cavenderia fasciculata]
MKEKNLLELERTIQANQVNQANQTEQQQQIMVDQILPNDLIEMVPRNNLTATNDFVKEYLNSTMTSTKLSTNLGNELKDMVKNQRISVIDLIVSFAQDLKKKQKIGSGRSNKGLYDSEIERIMKPYHRKGFERVIASDQLNLLEPKD